MCDLTRVSMLSDSTLASGENAGIGQPATRIDQNWVQKPGSLLGVLESAA